MLKYSYKKEIILLLSTKVKEKVKETLYTLVVTMFHHMPNYISIMNLKYANNIH